MARCSCCKKKQEKTIDKDGKGKINFFLFKARGGVYCPNCISANHDRLFPAPNQKPKKTSVSPLVQKRRENCYSSMVNHNTVDHQPYAAKVNPNPAKAKKKVAA